MLAAFAVSLLVVAPAWGQATGGESIGGTVRRPDGKPVRDVAFVVRQGGTQIGRGATGLTFYDDDTTSFFQPHCGQMAPLLMVAVGEPRTRRG